MLSIFCHIVNSNGHSRAYCFKGKTCRQQQLWKAQSIIEFIVQAYASWSACVRNRVKVDHHKMLSSPQNVVLQNVVLVVMCILFSVSNSMSPHLSGVIVTLVDTLHYNSGSKGCLPGQQATAAQCHCTKATRKRPYPSHATQKKSEHKESECKHAAEEWVKAWQKQDLNNKTLCKWAAAH